MVSLYQACELSNSPKSHGLSEKSLMMGAIKER